MNSRGLIRGGGKEPMLHSGKVTLDYEAFRRLDTLIFQGLRSKRVSLRHKAAGRGVALVERAQL